MEAALAQLSMHHAEIALRMVVGALLGGVIGWERNVEAVPFRILQAVVAGMALLAAGTILKGDGQVKGLTTGLGLWLAGAIGMAAGSGLYAVAVFIATLSFAILYFLRKPPKESDS